jgi:hypothetical protein
MSQSPVEKLDLGYEAASVAWGRENCQSVTFVDDVSGSIAGEYFDLNVMGSDFETVVGFRVWLDDSVASAPAADGRTLVAVSYSQDDTAGVIAGAAAAAIDALANVSASALDAVVTFENDFIGKVAVDSGSNAASLTFAQLQESAGGPLGTTSEGIELSIETQVGQLQANQTASYVLGEIVQGANVSMTMSLAEVTKERIETVVGGVTGDTFTPSAPGATSLTGLGESKLFQNLFDLGGKLILHPLSKDASDRTRDVIFWRSAPKPETLNYDGTTQQALAVTFVAYLDRSKPKQINIYAEGDWTQELV